VALVEEPRLRLLAEVHSIYVLAQSAIAAAAKLPDLVRQRATGALFDYDAIYEGQSEWSLLPPIDHPGDPARCLVSGTGLTHLGSARDRQSMHTASAEQMTDSMRMFRWGVEGGRPASGCIGTAPEWFYKGNGDILRGHGEALTVPSYAEDGGEEAEVAGVYIIGPDALPYRIGMAAGNEFSDHRFEKRNYLNLAGSKLRNCAIGPELVVDPDFRSVPGTVAIQRNGQVIWSKQIRTGEEEMCHSLQNIEHHHFKFESHRRPGDLHVHYFGAHSLSFGEGVQLRDGDVMEVVFEGFGRPLRNILRVANLPDTLVSVRSLSDLVS
jgi:hypothetical protein